MSTLAELRNIIELPNGKTASVKLDFESNVAFTVPILTTIAQSAYTGWGSFMDPFWTSNVDYLRCDAVAFDVVPNPDFPDPDRPDLPPKMRQGTLGPISSAGAAIPGTRVGTELPAQVAVVASFKTNIPSRRRRGRIFLPGPPEADVGPTDLMVGTYAAGLQAAVNDWIVGIQNSAVFPNTFTHVVVTLQQEVDAAEPVTSRVVRNRVDTQRRRLVRE